MEEPSPDDLATLALNERELFSLYVQYPEIDFDPECNKTATEAPNHFSSPASKLGDHDLDSVHHSNSTAHTTPSRHEMFDAASSNDDEYTAYCSQLQQCDLPAQTVRLFKNMGAQVVQMGPCLLEDHRSDDITKAHSSLLQQLQHSTRKVDEEVATIAFVTDLAPFNIVPTDTSLWSNYKQRASLVCKYAIPSIIPPAEQADIPRHLSSPSQTELNLLSQLLRVFDAYIYHPYLHLKTTSSNFDISTSATINNLYNALLNLLSSYKRWIRSMSSFKQSYMTPIMRRIQDSPWIQREIEQMEETLGAAQKALALHNGKEGLVLQDEQIEETTKVVERRAKSSGAKGLVVVKGKEMGKQKGGRRLKRELTI